MKRLVVTIVAVLPLAIGVAAARSLGASDN